LEFRQPRAWPILVEIICVLVADQASKAAIRSSMLIGQSREVIKRVFHLTYVMNSGGAFGLFPRSTWLFTAAALVLLFGAYAMLRASSKNEVLHSIFSKRLGILGLGILLGGALGNLIDRIRLGAVVDFLDFRVWPVFNLADIGIVLGLIALGYCSMVSLEAVEEGAEGEP
jgi:signal peptidase II